VAGRRRKADAELIQSLACGATPESAAQKTGFSLRTIYRRLADPEFGKRVQELRAEMVRRVSGMLDAAGMGSIKTFAHLQSSAQSESVRLGAARAIIELGCKLRETVELTDRMAAVEVRLEALLDGRAKPDETRPS
jgi:hypothetical protein